MTQGAAAPGEETPRADWGRAADGIGLTGFAFFLLLCTTGVLPWSFWFDAIALWPLLIMSAGVKIAFEKSRAPWLVLLGPAIVLGGLGWVAAGARPETAPGPWAAAESVARPAEARSVRLDARVAGARLDVESRTLPPGVLADGRAAGRHGDSRLEAAVEGDEGRVRLRAGRKDGVVILPGRKERWEVGLPSDLPVRLDVNAFATRGRLDLSRGRVTDGTVQGFFMALDLRLPRPEVPVTLRLKGVFNATRISVPPGTPVRVHGAGLPFNAVDRHTPGDPGAPGYDVKVEGVFTAVSVDTRHGDRPPAPPPPPEAPLPEAPPRLPEAPPTPPAPRS